MKIEVYSPTIRRKEMDAVLTSLVEDKIGPGEQSRFLIQIARENLKFDYALALRSPAIALYQALKLLNPGTSTGPSRLSDDPGEGSPPKAGQGVLISALAPRYYLTVLQDLALTPVFCDVSSNFPCISRESIDAAMQKKPPGLEVKALVVTHTLGYVPDLGPILELGIPVIEDASDSFSPVSEEGAKASERQAGVFVLLGLEERNILTAGGGALLYAVNRRDASVLRNSADLPPEYCLPDMNAAMAVIQFREAAKNLARRKEIAAVYTQSSLRTRHKRFVQEGDYNNYAFPLILETGLKDVKAYARKKDIVVESAFEDTLAGTGAVDAAQCTEAYSLSLRTVLFPLYPRLQASEVERVGKLILTLP
ncbi:MAG: DegT/DnrJ/EryC1/StrS family aminotransferase [Treponema sp.]|jgi:dTDP-4-amino-4,6-dideoxygalactose transaminase|nr:DegT/DnrJ/EryC1/StrS family aminotransferase [Treponema sp.]